MLRSEYMLWTDAGSREFIAENYPWFLDTFDAYPYPIQRADAIRYFVLYHYGGVYLDLDIGCKRPLDQLLVYPVILPKTIPVGVSNDLMFSEKKHPFMAQTIHNLITFDHSWILNYPTVMFSTGPMFLSAQYGFWTSSHAPSPESPGGEIRILPKALYGKNAKPGEAPHSFFSHYYGSSWHADDAAFIGFLGKWGKGLMWIGLVVLIVGIGRLLLQKKGKRREGGGRFGGYEVLLPRSYHRNGGRHIDLGVFTLTTRSHSGNSSPATPTSSRPATPVGEGDRMRVLPLSINVNPPSPVPSDSTSSDIWPSRRSGALDVLYRTGNRVLSSFTHDHEGRGRPLSRRAWQNRGVLFFLPAVLVPGSGVRLDDDAPSARSPLRRSQSRSPANDYRPDNKSTLPLFDAEAGASTSAASSSVTSPVVPPPPYPANTGTTSTPGRSWNGDGTWEDWDSR